MGKVYVPNRATLLFYIFSDRKTSFPPSLPSLSKSHPAQDECGEWVTALCPYGEEGCPDNEGDYDIIMPEPMSGTSGSGYKVRVVDVDDEEDGDCSDDFYLIGSDEAPKVGDSDGPSLEVTSPAEGDLAEACNEYTIEVRL